MIAVGYDKEIQEWVSNILKVKVGGDQFTSLAIVEDNDIVAGAIYHEYRGHMIEISLASNSPKWCTRANLKAIFSYPFKQLNVARLNATCSKKNKRMRSILKRLGFREEGVFRRAFDGSQDAVCYGMLKDECNWID